MVRSDPSYEGNGVKRGFELIGERVRGRAERSGCGAESRAVAVGLRGRSGWASSGEGFHGFVLKAVLVFSGARLRPQWRWSFAPSSASYPHVSSGLSATKPLRSFEADEASRLIL